MGSQDGFVAVHRRRCPDDRQRRPSRNGQPRSSSASSARVRFVIGPARARPAVGTVVAFAHARPRRPRVLDDRVRQPLRKLVTVRLRHLLRRALHLGRVDAAAAHVGVVGAHRGRSSTSRRSSPAPRPIRARASRRSSPSRSAYSSVRRLHGRSTNCAWLARKPTIGDLVARGCPRDDIDHRARVGSRAQGRRRRRRIARLRDRRARRVRRPRRHLPAAAPAGAHRRLRRPGPTTAPRVWSDSCATSGTRSRPTAR